MISVLCPSRDRPQLLRRSVASLRDLATSHVEILVAADDDDPATVRAAGELGVRVVVFRRAGYARLYEYYQRLAELALGDWLLIWNDDAVMTTRYWDEAIHALPPEVLVADLESPHSPLCCFPAVRRQAVDALGRFCTDNPHVDTFWQDAGRAANTIRQVPVYAACDSPVRPGQSHGYYEPEHQAELAACTAVLAGALR